MAVYNVIVSIVGFRLLVYNQQSFFSPSFTTGESVPVTKTSLPLERRPYSSKSHRAHTLYAGTHIVQARYYSQQLVLALVIRTGFLTSKGGMVRSILFPKPLNIKFYWDSIKFILILSLLAACGFVYTFLVLQLRTTRVSDAIIVMRLSYDFVF